MFLEIKEATKEEGEIKNSYILKAKSSLYDICTDKMNEYLRKKDAAAAFIYESIRDGNSAIFQEIFRINISSPL